jgi:hypothetical protein
MKIVFMTDKKVEKFNKIKKELLYCDGMIERDIKVLDLKREMNHNSYLDALKFDNREVAYKNLSSCCEDDKELLLLEREKVLTEAIIELIEALA